MTTPDQSDGPEPYLLAPRLWFGLLCEQFTRDERGRLDFQRVFNQVAYETPADSTGIPPHGDLNGILAIGYQRGLGDFTLRISLHDADGHQLERGPEPIPFTLGPGADGIVLAANVRHWLRQPGQYYFALRLEPGPREDQIPFEVSASIVVAAEQA